MPEGRIIGARPAPAELLKLVESLVGPPPGRRRIFVFGSNLAGRHGKGEALEARQRWGAVYGVGEGRTGDAYAIPTKDHQIEPRHPKDIRDSVNTFLDYARVHPELDFQVTAIGCGLAGYKPWQIAPMFEYAPANVLLPDSFRGALGRG